MCFFGWNFSRQIPVLRWSWAELDPGNHPMGRRRASKPLLRVLYSSWQVLLYRVYWKQWNWTNSCPWCVLDIFEKNKSSLLKLGPEGNASLLGILQHPDGTVLKQLQPPPRGPREQEFYNKVRVLHSRGSCLAKGGVTAGVQVTVCHYCRRCKGVGWISEWYMTDSLVPVSASFLELSPPWVSVPVPGLLNSQD